MSHFLSNKYPQRSESEQKIGDVVLQLLDKYKLKNKLFEQHIINSWEKIVGKTIHKHTTGINIHDKKITISLNSPSLREELMLGKTQLKELINKEIGTIFIEDIIIK